MKFSTFQRRCAGPRAAAAHTAIRKSLDEDNDSAIVRVVLGVGVPRNRTMTFHWFRKAADQRHPLAPYNLALGHLKG
jgi:TPR repeat protein